MHMDGLGTGVCTWLHSHMGILSPVSPQEDIISHFLSSDENFPVGSAPTAASEKKNMNLT